MVVKTHFEFTIKRAVMIRKLAEYEAQETHAPGDTQGFLNRLVESAYEEMQAEQAAKRKLRTCQFCGQSYTGRPECPKCGTWNN